MEYIVGVDMGGTHLRLGMVTTDGALQHVTVVRTSVLYENKEALATLMDVIAQYVTEHSVGTLKAIAIGFPSTISKDKQVIYSTPNVPGFDNINVVAPLTERFGVPVFIDHDVHFLLQAEMVKRNLSDALILGFYIGTGYGNSIYLYDRFLDGKNGVAGEVGHIPVLGSEVLCGCGNYGCIEPLAAGKGLCELHEQHFSAHPLSEVFVAYAGHPVIDKFIQAMAVPIITEINIFDPDYVIIGGGVPSMAGFPRELLETYIRKNTRKPFPEEGLEILYADAAPEDGVLGAALYAYQKLNKPVQATH